jgi:hemoglobin
MPPGARGPSRGSLKTLENSMRLTVLAVAALAMTAVPAAAQMGQASLYQRLGGYPAITAVVDDFVGNVAADKRINRFFARTDIPRLKVNLVNQICAGTGGPCIYTGRDMKSAHAGMGVNSGHFNALVQDLQKTLKKFKVPKKEQGELLAVLGPMKKDIVTR